jgi:hypothetical protein
MRLDEMRAKAYEMLRSSTGNKFLPVRLGRGVLTFMNDMAGRPLAPVEELEERRDYETRRVTKAKEAAATREKEAHAAKNGANGAAKKREAAPVCVYVDGRSPQREVKRITDVLRGRDIPFTQLDVEGDESTKSWVTTTAKSHELPLVFVAGQPIGDFHALVQADAAGELTRLVFGA